MAIATPISGLPSPSKSATVGGPPEPVPGMACPLAPAPSRVLPSRPFKIHRCPLPTRATSGLPSRLKSPTRGTRRAARPCARGRCRRPVGGVAGEELEVVVGRAVEVDEGGERLHHVAAAEAEGAGELEGDLARRGGEDGGAEGDLREAVAVHVGDGEAAAPAEGGGPRCRGWACRWCGGRCRRRRSSPRSPRRWRPRCRGARRRRCRRGRSTCRRSPPSSGWPCRATRSRRRSCRRACAARRVAHRGRAGALLGRLAVAAAGGAREVVAGDDDDDRRVELVDHPVAVAVVDAAHHGVDHTSV